MPLPVQFRLALIIALADAEACGEEFLSVLPTGRLVLGQAEAAAIIFVLPWKRTPANFLDALIADAATALAATNPL